MKFGIRECADMVFKTTAPNQKVGNTTFAKAGMPAFHIDTARTSTLEQATTTVYAQGGRGYNRLISWEGEKTMTFTVEDALISPMGLAVLTGAGFVAANKDNFVHYHITLDTTVDNEGLAKVEYLDLERETGLNNAPYFTVCNCSEDDYSDAYATVLDGSGYGVAFVPEALVLVDAEGADIEEAEVEIKANEFVQFKVGETYAGQTVRLDFYLLMLSDAIEIDIRPEDFGGYFYVEAATLFRREDNGQDMAASLIMPKVKIQSGFSFTMAGSGDPSTFTFTMDAFPGYTKFNRKKKTMCQIQILGSDAAVGSESANNAHDSELHHPAYVTKKFSAIGA